MEHICKDLEKIFTTNGEAFQRIKLLEECENYSRSLSDKDLASVAVTSIQFIYCNTNVRKLFFKTVKQQLKKKRERVNEQRSIA